MRLDDYRKERAHLLDLTSTAVSCCRAVSAQVTGLLVSCV